MTYPDDHFYRQFDRFPEGEERTEAVARHAAFLLNTLDDNRRDHRKLLLDILQLLSDKQEVKAALKIVEALRDD